MRVLNRITRFLSWLSLIWNDQDWDWLYFMRLLNRKLSNMEGFFASDKTHLANSDKVARRIKYARILTDRILADEYSEMVFKGHYEKWGIPIYGSEPTADGMSEYTIDMPNAKTAEQQEQERKEHLALSKHSREMKTQDIRDLFEHMAKYMQGWWD